MTFDTPLESIPFQGLPIAGGRLEANGAIGSANHHFVRLCGRAGHYPVAAVLRTVVAQPFRVTAERRLVGLDPTVSSGQASRHVTVGRRRIYVNEE
jgi:hypothetical protein